MLRIRYLVWKPFYDVGHRQLDDQHREIVNIINELYSAIQEDRDRAALRPVLDRLVDCTERHFEYEEELLEEVGYPDLEQHKAIHDSMRRKTVELREKLGLAVGREQLAFLKSWWASHIQRQDKPYSAYLEGLVHA